MESWKYTWNPMLLPSSPGLTAKELLVYFDDDGNGALSAAELATVLWVESKNGGKNSVRRNEVPCFGRAQSIMYLYRVVWVFIF